MLTEALEVMRYVKASAGRSNLNVVFEDTNQPRHDGNTIYLPKITAATTLKELKQMMASTDHEVSHDHYSSFTVVKDANINMDGALGVIWNCIEDSRVNNLEALEYYGFKQLWDESASDTVAEMAVKLAAHKDNPQAMLMGSICKWALSATGSMFPTLAVVAATVPSDARIDAKLPSFTTRFLGTLEIEDKTAGSTATLELAKDIFKALGGKITYVKKPTSGSGDEPESGSKDTVEGEPGAEAKADGADTKTGDLGEERKDSDDDYRIDEGSDMPPELKTTEHSSRFGKVGIKTTSSLAPYDWHLTPFEEFSVIDYHTNSIYGPKIESVNDFLEESYSTRQFKEEYARLTKQQGAAPEGFAQQVRRLIQIRAKSRTEYGVKKGKLDQARLSRVCFDTPGFNERIFKNKIVNNTLDAAVSVLIDMSGSMSGMKVLTACEAMVLLNETFSNALHIPLEVTGFTDVTQASFGKWIVAPVQLVYKSFANPRVSSEQLVEYMALSESGMNGNPDGENILWAYDRLRQRKEKKKLLIVLSDGQPAASKGGRIGHFTKEVIKQIEDANVVDIYGLGILSSDVKSYYKHHSVVDKVSELPTKLIEVIERKLLNL